MQKDNIEIIFFSDSDFQKLFCSSKMTMLKFAEIFPTLEMLFFFGMLPSFPLFLEVVLSFHVLYSSFWSVLLLFEKHLPLSSQITTDVP